MGCSWDIRCLDCNANYGLEGNHAAEFMREAIRLAASIADIASLVDVKIRSRFGLIDPEWFVEHANHRLAAVNEYGEVDGECNKTVKCSACGTDHRCRLPRGHASPCENGK